MITWDVFIYVTIPWIRCKIREWVHDEKIREWIHDEISFVMFLMGYDDKVSDHLTIESAMAAMKLL